jgi:ligand-binding SRPBCC domain-containing protein
VDAAATNEWRDRGVVSVRREGARRVLEARTWLPGQSSERAFPFFTDAFNLEAITPDWLHFEVLTPPPIAVAEGTVIDYRLRLHGVPLRWRSLIRDWRPPSGFVDTQIAGPYAEWVHHHWLTDTPAGVVAGDRVVYRIRGGRLAHAVAASALADRDLLRIFRYRSQRLRELLARRNSV